jgi:hypothetical protein
MNNLNFKNKILVKFLLQPIDCKADLICRVDPKTNEPKCVPISHSGVCPEFRGGIFWICDKKCSNDADCASDEKCCSMGCRTDCKSKLMII